MGSGVSHLQTDEYAKYIMTLIATIRNSRGWDRVQAIKELWRWAEYEEYKFPLTEPSVGLISDLVVSIGDGTTDELRNALGVLWYISTCDDHLARVRLAEEPELLSRVSYIYSSEVDDKRNSALSIIINLASHADSSIYIFKKEMKLIEPLVSLCEDDPLPIIALSNLAATCPPEYVHTLINSKAHIQMLHQLRLLGINPKQWPDRARGSGYYSMRFFQFFVRHRSAVEAMKHVKGLHLFDQLMDHVFDCSEGLKATMIVAMLVGSDENKTGRQAMLVSNPHFLDPVFDALTFAVNKGMGQALYAMKRLSGYEFGDFPLKLLVETVRSLAISDANKHSLVSNRHLLTLLLMVLEYFISNSPEICGHDDFHKAANHIGGGAHTSCIGGGASDVESVSAAIEAILHLSFYFDSDYDLKEHYMTSDLEVSRMLADFLSLPEERLIGISLETKRHANLLLNRFDELPMKAVSTRLRRASVDDGRIHRRHIMISYDHGAKKELVMELADTLRKSGYEVWLEDTGSVLVPAASEELDTRFVEAIELSHCIIVCVSPQYKNSASCRAEARYCAMKSKNTQMSIYYTMLYEEYTPDSLPDAIDGWLDVMMGSDHSWLPLWKVEQISAAAKALEKSIGDRAKPALWPAIDDSVTSFDMSPAKDSESRGGAPVSAVSIAWSYLQEPNYIKDANGLKSFLSELGLTGAEELPLLEPKDLKKLSTFLKPIKAKAFMVKVLEK